MNVKVNSTTVGNNSKAIKNSSKYLCAQSEYSKDEKSTVTCNKKLQSAFEKSQKLIDKLGENMTLEENNINNLGIAFQDIDKAIAARIDG